MFLHRLSFIFSSVLLLALSGCASLSEPSLETFAWEEELDAVKLSRGWEAAGDWLKQRQAEMIADGASTEDIYALSKEASELFHLLEDLPNAALVEERAVTEFSARGDALHEARARALLSETLYWQGEAETADAMAVSALALFEDPERTDPDLAVRLYTQRAMILTDGDDLHAPLEPISIAETIAEHSSEQVSHGTRAALFVWLSRIHRQIAVSMRVNEEDGAETHDQLARDYALNAVASARLDGDLQTTAIYLEALSRVEWNMGLREEAIAHLGEGLALMEETGLNHGRDYALLAGYMTFYTMRTGRQAAAVNWGENALDVMADVYAQALTDPDGPTPDMHSGLTFVSVAMLEAVFNGETASGDLPEESFERIFQVAQLNKMTAMSHAMVLAAQDAGSRNPDLLALASQRQALQLAWRDIENQLGLWRRSGRSSQDPAHLIAARGELSAQIDALTSQIAELDVTYDRLWQTNKTSRASIAELQSVLKPDEAYILLTSLYSDIYVIVITRESKWAHVASFDLGEACQLASQIRNALTISSPLVCDAKGGTFDDESAESTAFDPDAAYTYYDRVFGPAADLLDSKSTWILSLARTQAVIPVGALLRTRPEPGAGFGEMDWLGRSKALVHAPSAQALIASRDQPKTENTMPGKLILAGAPCLGRYRGEACRDLMEADAERAMPSSRLVSHFRNTDSYEGPLSIMNLDGLPGAYQELKDVQALEEQQIESLIADQFTEERFTNWDWSETETLLIATHVLSAGDFSLGQPALVLTPPASFQDSESDSNGLLTAGEIAHIPMDVDLVILSGCSTAGPDGAPRGEMFSGLTLGFLQAGARSILATHFEVEDGFTSGFVPSVMAGHHGGEALTVPEALRVAIATLLQDEGRSYYHHPRYWAGYVVYGGGN